MIDDGTGRIYGGVHAPMYFCVMDSNVSEAAIEPDEDLGIWYVTGVDFDLMFQVWV